MTVIAAAEDAGPDVATQARCAALATLALHLAIVPYDVATGFRAFTWGDRGMERLRMVKEFADLRGSVTGWMTDAPVVPGEYLFAVLPWKAGGPLAVILLQIALATMATWLVARIAGRVVPWPRAALGCGLIYALLPQNVAFPHQLTTEAIATPFCVAWLALLLAAVRREGVAAFVGAGLCLGVAIFLRPVIAAMLPIALVLALAVPAARATLRRPELYAMAAAALAPLLLWTAAFTLHTDQLGYNKGSANLGWNLRSKALITERANGIDPPAELLDDDGFISTSRFVEEVAEHPVPFAKAFVLDVATVFARGNSTKISVDYLGIDRDPAGWRQKLLYDKDAEVSRWGNAANPVYVIEALASLVTAGFFLFCFWQVARIGLALVRGAAAPSIEFVFLTIITAAWLANVFLSAQLVNEAQGRLRNPAEACFILFAAMALARRKRFPAARQEAAVREANAPLAV